MEWWYDIFLTFQVATELGVTVVEAGGNGFENYDDDLYYTSPAPGFPTGLQPFDRTLADSGAVIVGAGAPRPGTHGNFWGPDRSRLDYSNHGTWVDTQGIGREVTTLGYGDLFGTTEQTLYTDTFSGTSSSSPCVAGAVAVLQSIAQETTGAPLSPHEVREILRDTGSPQQPSLDSPLSQNIGQRPDLQEMIASIGFRKN